jgi:hypothetical protein
MLREGSQGEAHSMLQRVAGLAVHRGRLSPLSRYTVTSTLRQQHWTCLGESVMI